MEGGASHCDMTGVARKSVAWWRFHASAQRRGLMGLFRYLWLHYRKRCEDSKCVRATACGALVCIKWRSTFLRYHAKLNPLPRSISSPIPSHHRFSSSFLPIICMVHLTWRENWPLLVYPFLK